MRKIHVGITAILSIRSLKTKRRATTLTFLLNFKKVKDTGVLHAVAVRETPPD